MRVLVCGGRNYLDVRTVWKTLDDLHTENGITTVIQGGARGADHCATLWCKDYKIPCLTVRADWQQYGRKAGPLRNQEMIDLQKPDLVVAFPGGKGTADMVRRARIAGIDLIEVGDR